MNVFKILNKFSDWNFIWNSVCVCFECFNIEHLLRTTMTRFCIHIVLIQHVDSLNTEKKWQTFDRTLLTPAHKSFVFFRGFHGEKKWKTFVEKEEMVARIRAMMNVQYYFLYVDDGECVRLAYINISLTSNTLRKKKKKKMLEMNFVNYHCHKLNPFVSFFSVTFSIFFWFCGKNLIDWKHLISSRFATELFQSFLLFGFHSYCEASNRVVDIFRITFYLINLFLVLICYHKISKNASCIEPNTKFWSDANISINSRFYIWFRTFFISKLVLRFKLF